MYVRRIEVENCGPISYMNYVFPFDAEDKPQPVLFVGQNGAGKSILLSQLVNAMIAAKSVVFKDSDVKPGTVYKLRSPTYVRFDARYSRSYVHFDSQFYLGEIQTLINKRSFEDQFQMTPADKNWQLMDDAENSLIASNILERKSEIYEAISKFTYLYFPANRFEEPAWLNAENLANVTEYLSGDRMTGISGRRIVTERSLKANQSWLLDVLYDSFAVERQVKVLNMGGFDFPTVEQINGPSTKLRIVIESFLRRLFRQDGLITWGVGERGKRGIAVSIGGKTVTRNLFSLSTGQTALLNMFLTIIRDYDLSDATLSSIEDIRGTVVIDEVDLHLHTELQYAVLPELIAAFSGVQFIITTHSPLFILGLEKRLGAARFSLIELPEGKPIGVERFTEFEAAYHHFRESARFEHDMQKAIIESQTPVLMMEGALDIDYINRAAELLGRKATLQRFRLLEANGFGGLDKIWKHFDLNVAKLTNQRVVLVYDCDIKKPSTKKEGVTRITIPAQSSHISTGIENLFPDDFIASACAASPAFIDVTPAIQRSLRGAIVTEAEKWEVNPDEKRNLATWIIQNGTAADFVNFNILFDLIDAA